MSVRLPPLPDRALLADLCREAAALERVEPQLIEKDFYLTRLLWALGQRFGDALLLKGGTLLNGSCSRCPPLRCSALRDMESADVGGVGMAAAVVRALATGIERSIAVGALLALGERFASIRSRKAQGQLLCVHVAAALRGHSSIVAGELASMFEKHVRPSS